MTDAISRCELFNKLATIPAPPEANDFKAEVYKVIQQMETMDKWIPCSERLPSECDEFLITWTASVTNEPLLAFAEYEPDAFLVSGGKWHLEDDMREFKDVDVIAWMPLPKPWKGADDEL